MVTQRVTVPATLLIALVCFACNKQEATSKGAKEEKPVQKVEGLGAPVPTGVSGYELARALLAPDGKVIDDVKLALKPEQLKAAGAMDFHPFMATPGGDRLLLYVFEYPDEDAAAAAREGLAGFLEKGGLMHDVLVVERGHLVLAAGLEEPGEPSAAVARERQAYLALFAR